VVYLKTMVPDYGYNYVNQIRITFTLPYVTGGTSTSIHTLLPQTSASNFWGPLWVEVPRSPVTPINRRQRRLLDSGKLPHDASRIVELLYGKRGQHCSVAEWDSFFFKFWMRVLPRDHMPRQASRTHQMERYTSPLRRFTGGKIIVRKS
jgi:hypothetical protein